MKIRRIEINFPEPVELTNDQQNRLDAIAGEMCKAYGQMHPGRVMWPFGCGFKITYMPMTREEEQAGKHIEFDPDTFEIECSEREDYKWLCTKCGHEQGDHRTSSTDTKAPAGDCDFEPNGAKKEGTT